MRTWKIPRESNELVGPITVTDDEQPVTTFDVALTLENRRPTIESWAPADIIEAKAYVHVGVGSARPLAVGKWRIWVRFIDNPEVPVIDDVGIIQIT